MGTRQEVSNFDATFDEASTQQPFNDMGRDSVAEILLIDVGATISAHGRTRCRRTSDTSRRTWNH